MGTRGVLCYTPTVAIFGLLYSTLVARGRVCVQLCGRGKLHCPHPPPEHAGLSTRYVPAFQSHPSSKPETWVPSSIPMRSSTSTSERSEARLAQPLPLPPRLVPLDSPPRRSETTLPRPPATGRV